MKLVENKINEIWLCWIFLHGFNFLGFNKLSFGINNLKSDSVKDHNKNTN